jgi:hypothetical protein
VVHAVVNFIAILGELPLKLFERPNCLTFRINAFGHLPHMTSDLRVAAKIMDELGVQSAILWRFWLCGPELGPSRKTSLLLGLSTT